MRSTEIKNNTEGGLTGIFYISKGLVFSFIVSLLLMLIASIVLRAFFPYPKAIYFSSLAVILLSAGFYGFYSSRHAQTSGLLNGALSGLFYFLVLFLIGSLAKQSVDFSLSCLSHLMLSLIGGSIGGILGVNTLKPSRRR